VREELGKKVPKRLSNYQQAVTPLTINPRGKLLEYSGKIKRKKEEKCYSCGASGGGKDSKRKNQGKRLLP